MTPAPKRQAGTPLLPALIRYWNTSRRPLQVLAFLFPLVVAYELGLLLLLRPEDITNLAHKRLLQFFNLFGVSGLSLGGAAILMVLLIWHLLTRDPWKVDWKALGVMAVESVLLALPLMVMAQAIAALGRADGGALAAAASAGSAGGADRIAHLGIAARVTFCIGTGLYEEFLFRMLIIALLHTLLVDVGKASPRLGAAIAVFVSAALFMWYHFTGQAAHTASIPAAAFYFLAGLYFGAVYVLRGFGLAVGCHAVYDILTVLLISRAG